MFTKVTISNFRTFEKVVLDDLGTTTALIGRNAAGKSNLLHALDVFGRLATATDDGRAGGSAPTLSRDLGNQTPSFAAEIELAEGRYSYSCVATRVLVRPPAAKRATFQLSLTERLDWTDTKPSAAPRRLFSRTRETISLSEPTTDIRTGHATPALAALAALLPADSSVRRLTEPLRRFLARVRYYPLDEPARDSTFRFISGGEYNEWVNEYRRTGVLSDPVPAQLLYLALTTDDRYAELKNRLGRKGLRLVDELTFRELTDEGPRTPELDPETGQLNPDALCEVRFHLSHGDENSDGDRSFAQLSQGTRRLVRLLTAMAFGDNSVMLIEHPEDGIHRGLVKKVTGLFTTGFCPSQIFLSTHSDTVLNGLEPEAIRFVSLDDGKSTVRKMTPAERKAAREYIDSDAEGTLAEFARSIED